MLAGLMLIMPLAIDLTVKKLAQHRLDYGQPLEMFPGFNLTLLFNPGVSFGLLPAGSPAGLALMLAVQAILSIGIALYAWGKRHTHLLWPLLLLLSGALGNLIDRYLNGAVTDYLDFYVNGFQWPAFNFADVWITLGVVGLIAVDMLDKRQNAQKPPERVHSK